MENVFMRDGIEVPPDASAPKGTSGNAQKSRSLKYTSLSRFILKRVSGQG